MLAEDCGEGSSRASSRCISRVMVSASCAKDVCLPYFVRDEDVFILDQDGGDVSEVRFAVLTEATDWR